MFCVNCGAGLNDGDEFCRNCGWKVGKQVSNGENNDLHAKNNNSTRISKSNSKSRPTKAIIAIVAVIVCAVVAKNIVFDNKINKFKKDVNNAKVVSEYQYDNSMPILGMKNGSNVIYQIDESKVDTVKFGKYPQSDITGRLYEDIEWYVIAKNGDRALLLSKYILDNKSWNYVNEVTNWPDSIICNFLNNDFYNKAFSVDEKAIILNEMHSYEYWEKEVDKVYLDRGSNDKVFILSRNEVNKYGIVENLNNNLIYQDGMRLYRCYDAVGTEYAKNVENGGCKLYIRDQESFYNEHRIGTSEWMLRSGNGRFRFTDTTGGGSVSYVDGYRGLRPAVWVKYK